MKVCIQTFVGSCLSMEITYVEVQWHARTSSQTMTLIQNTDFCTIHCVKTSHRTYDMDLLTIKQITDKCQTITRGNISHAPVPLNGGET